MGGAGFEAVSRRACGGGASAAGRPGEDDGGEDRATWVARASCRSGDPERLFVRGAAQRAAATICRGCPVQLECLADALDHGVEFGVWGGLTERERRALLRERPDVTSWLVHLTAIRDERRAAARTG